MDDFSIGQRVRIDGLDMLGTIKAVHRLVIAVEVDGGAELVFRLAQAERELSPVQSVDHTADQRGERLEKALRKADDLARQGRIRRLDPDVALTRIGTVLNALDERLEEQE